jgi:primosomal protein N' (replication factor Y) (superfamily II helicase)
MSYAKVAIDRYVDKVFDYCVPAEWEEKVAPGMRVLVDFRGKKTYAVVTELSSTTDVPEGRMKSILSADEENVLLDKVTLDLARWISEYYCCPLGMVLKSIIPSEVRNMKRKHSHLSAKDASEDLDTYLPPVPHVLNESQEKALDSLKDVIDSGTYRTFLLHGVTGSGKTEVYLRAIEHARKKGLQCIMIVPEIALTPQMIETFKTRFRDVALYHSQLSPKQRRAYWLGMKNGFFNIVIGARSAVFAPLQNLGLIIVDEEHERTYKQYETPFYNARDVAIMRGLKTGSCVVLGSATPSMESYANCEKGKFTLLQLPSRVDEKELPEVKIVDMNQELRKNKGRNPVFSDALLENLQKRLDAGEQSILFLNRRGYSTLIFCEQCGWIARCGSCSIAFTFHKEAAGLTCHRCEEKAALPKTCPQCRHPELKALGTGTEKVERQLKKIFPGAKIGRMDTDVTKQKDSYEEVLGNFRRGKIDIMVGTQMIAKGLDIPNVTLVGIIAADLALNLPDFRSAESTFQLITQVAGRAGRGAVKGDVILQTFSPDMQVIQLAAKQDYEGFYRSEKRFREELHYPPEIRFINVCFRGEDEVELARSVHASCSRLKALLQRTDAIFKGPSPSAIKKISKCYRWNMIIGTENVFPVCRVLNDFVFQEKGRSVQVVVDVDPLSVL